MTQPLLRVTDVDKSFTLYNQGGISLPVLRRVNLDLNPGECVALDGPSGAGKSTLLKLVYANYRASRGSIRVRPAPDAANQDDLEITTASARELTAYRRTTVGYVSQFLRAIPRVAALNIVAEPLAEDVGNDDAGLRDAERAAEDLLLRLRIPSRLWNLPPATFSGGEQQRVNIARSLIRPRPLLLLDEPTASLDTDNCITVTQLIVEARNRGAAILGAFHDASVRDAVATRVVDIGRFR